MMDPIIMDEPVDAESLRVRPLSLDPDSIIWHLYNRKVFELFPDGRAKLLEWDLRWWATGLCAICVGSGVLGGVLYTWGAQ